VHWRNVLDARVVDEHVDTSELTRRILDKPRRVGWLGESAALKAGAPRRSWQSLRSFRSRGLAEAVDHEIGASGGKCARNAEANPARRTGNDSTLPST